MTDDWRWLIGRDAPPETTQLRIGQLETGLAGLDLVDLRFGDMMILRRLAIRVRGAAWETLPHLDQKAEIRTTDDRTEIALSANNRGAGVALAWRATIQIDRGGTLDCAFEGRALGDTTYNRIGVVALFPLTIAGRPYRARQAVSSSGGRLPSLVDPQAIRDGVEFPLFPAFDHLEIDLTDGFSLTAELSGDLFEMEDQRNWTDGTFKLYSTPLSVPVPMGLKKGDALRQGLRLSFAGAPPARGDKANDTAVVLTCGEMLERTLPPLGIALDRDGHEPDAAELSLLRSLGLAHLHAAIATKPGDEDTLALAGRRASQLGCLLELALVFPADRDDIGPALAALAPRLAALPVVRLLLLPEGETVTPAGWLDQARAALGDRYPLVIGTGADFVELNRRRPRLSGSAGVAYAVNPQVHDDDDRALVQSFAGQRATVMTVRSFTPGAPVHVGPITLKPRSVGSPVRSRGGLPVDVDPRQATAFGAAWVAASAKHLAEAGAASLTFFESTGWRGVIERTQGTPLPDLFPSAPGTPFPAFHVLARLTRLQGAEIVACISAAPERVEALVVAGGNRWEALIWSLAPAPLGATLSGVRSARYRFDRLTPAGWVEGAAASPVRNELAIDLSPYELVALVAL